MKNENKDILTEMRIKYKQYKYKLYTVDEALDFCKELNIKTNDVYDITPYCQSMFKTTWKESNIIDQGLFYIQDEEDASHLGGAFFRHFGYLRLSLATNIEKLMTIEETIKYNFKWQMDLISKYPYSKNMPITLNAHLIESTKERPYTIYICGDDDFSWTLTYPTEDDAKRVIHDIYIRSKDIQCGGFKDALHNNCFIFTN